MRAASLAPTASTARAPSAVAARRRGAVASDHVALGQPVEDRRDGLGLARPLDRDDEEVPAFGLGQGGERGPLQERGEVRARGRPEGPPHVLDPAQVGADAHRPCAVRFGAPLHTGRLARTGAVEEAAAPCRVAAQSRRPIWVVIFREMMVPRAAVVIRPALTRCRPSSRAVVEQARSDRPARSGRDRGPDPGRDRLGRASEDRPEGWVSAAPSSSSRLPVPRLNAALAPAFFHCGAAACGDVAAARLGRAPPCPTCGQCGNDYDEALQVTMAGRPMTFDSFGAPSQAMAPDLRAHCGVPDRRARGRGGRAVFCCAHCALVGGSAALVTACAALLDAVRVRRGRVAASRSPVPGAEDRRR